MFVYDFGKRRIDPCEDCDSKGHCTMNCGPAVSTNDNPEGVLTVARIRHEGEKAKARSAARRKSRWA